jgi:hypothetical protein
MGTGCSYPGLKRSEREDDHSFPSSSEIKNEWIYSCNPPICLHEVRFVAFPATEYDEVFSGYQPGQMVE